MVIIVCIVKSGNSKAQNQDHILARINSVEDAISKQISSGNTDYLKALQEAQIDMHTVLSDASEKQIQTLYRISKEQAESAADNHSKLSSSLAENNKLLLETNIKSFNDVRRILYDFSDQQTKFAHSTDKTLTGTLQKNIGVRKQKRQLQSSNNLKVNPYIGIAADKLHRLALFKLAMRKHGIIRHL